MTEKMNREFQNIRILLQYDGSRYDGWQKQGNTEKTIQGKLEQVLEQVHLLQELLLVWLELLVVV